MNISKLFKPTYKDIKRPLTTFEAAVLVSGISPSLTNRQKRKDGSVQRLQYALQKACLIYEDEKLSDEYRLEHGIPSAWDGGVRVMEEVQVKRWRKRRFTARRRPRYKTDV